jgi:protein transport protein SEC23
MEMRALPEKTGGHVVMSESYTGNIFKQSFKAVFALDSTGQSLRMAFGASLEVLTSAEFKVCMQTLSTAPLPCRQTLTTAPWPPHEFQVCGAIGNCASLAKKSPNVAETEIGTGNTNAWAISGLDEDTTLALYFEVTNPPNDEPRMSEGSSMHVLTTAPAASSPR